MTKGDEKLLFPLDAGSRVLAQMLEDAEGNFIAPLKINQCLTTGIKKPKLSEARSLPKARKRVKKGANARWRTNVKRFLRKSKNFQPALFYNWNEIDQKIDELSFRPGESLAANEKFKTGMSYSQSEFVTIDPFESHNGNIIVTKTPDYTDLVRRESQFFEAILLDVLPIVQDAITGVDKKYRELPAEARGLYLSKCHVARNRFVRKVLKPLMDG